MGAAAKAIWLIEQHHAAPLSLEALSEKVGLSRFHLSRLFASAVGLPPMAYARARRLSEAAIALDLGLSVTDAAFGAGYESPEAFSRAFREEFGLPPSALKAGGGLAGLPLTHPFTPEEDMTTTLIAPRFETRAAFAVSGLSARFDMSQLAGVPAVWGRFAPHFGTFPMAEPGVSWGVISHEPGAQAFDYLAGAEPKGAPPADLETVRVPAARYAVFTHEGHVSDIRKTMAAIFDEWLPASGETEAESPELERYDHRFDISTLSGVVELWIPLR